MRTVQDIASEKEQFFTKLSFRMLPFEGRTCRVKVYNMKALFREYKVKKH